MTEHHDPDITASAPRIFIGRLQASMMDHHDQVARYDAEFPARLVAAGGVTTLITLASDAAESCPSRMSEALSVAVALHTQEDSLVAAHRCLAPTIAALASVYCPPGACSQMQGFELDVSALAISEGVVEALGQIVVGMLADGGIPNPVEGLDELREAFFSQMP